MAAGVLLDTSFLITLAGKNRAHHETARRYWQHFLENQIPIFLSSIQFKAIKLEDGFDRAFFDPNGQRDFADGLDEGNGGQS